MDSYHTLGVCVCVTQCTRSSEDPWLFPSEASSLRHALWSKPFTCLMCKSLSTQHFGTTARDCEPYYYGAPDVVVRLSKINTESGARTLLRCDGDMKSCGNIAIAHNAPALLGLPGGGSWKREERLNVPQHRYQPLAGRSSSKIQQ